MLWFSNEQSLEEPEARLPPPGDAWAAIPAGAAHLPSSRQSQFSCIPAMLHHRLFPAPSRCTVPVVAGCFWSPPQTWRGSTSRSDSRWQDEVSLVWSVLQQTFKQCFVATISSLELSSALRKITARKRKKKKPPKLLRIECKWLGGGYIWGLVLVLSLHILEICLIQRCLNQICWRYLKFAWARQSDLAGSAVSGRWDYTTSKHPFP